MVCKRIDKQLGRAPQGARGLKFHSRLHSAEAHSSRPTRGAWIEMQYVQRLGRLFFSRAPQGARGLKSFPLAYPKPRALRRAPQGARGLKFDLYGITVYYKVVPPHTEHVD